MSIAHSQLNTFLRLLGRLDARGGSGTDFPAKVEALLREEKSAGSRDRRLYRELFYTHCRHRPWLAGLEAGDFAALLASLAAETPATRVFRATFALPSLPEGLDRRRLLPAWFESECPEAFSEPLLGVLNQRAPLWLRLQGAQDQEVLAEFAERGWAWQTSPSQARALRVLSEADVTRTTAFERGLFEVQDLGSQLVLETVAPEHGTRWLDACAGAGGKTLQLACLLGREGRVDASDVRPSALQELRLRAARAGLVEGNEGRVGALVRVPSMLSDLYDGVLVDAPCSGSGTWRRAPHLKWCTSLEKVRRSAALQLSILREQAVRVRQGGLLAYATCSLCTSENEGVVQDFLAHEPGFRRLRQRRLLPHEHDGDGFFVSVLVRDAG